MEAYRSPHKIHKGRTPQQAIESDPPMRHIKGPSGEGMKHEYLTIQIEKLREHYIQYYSF